MQALRQLAAAARALGRSGTSRDPGCEATRRASPSARAVTLASTSASPARRSATARPSQSRARRRRARRSAADPDSDPGRSLGPLSSAICSAFQARQRRRSRWGAVMCLCPPACKLGRAAAGSPRGYSQGREPRPGLTGRRQERLGQRRNVPTRRARLPTAIENVPGAAAASPASAPVAALEGRVVTSAPNDLPARLGPPKREARNRGSRVSAHVADVASCVSPDTIRAGNCPCKPVRSKS
jgi:hypothetical protein